MDGSMYTYRFSEMRSAPNRKTGTFSEHYYNTVGFYPKLQVPSCKMLPNKCSNLHTLFSMMLQVCQGTWVEFSSRQSRWDDNRSNSP
jgi:hypothetical protein